MPRILGVDRIEFGPDKLGGLIPVGTVLGFFNHISGSHTIPTSGLVVDGFMRCDGSAIPGGQKLSGTTPNLSDQRFLQGNTTSSATLQGANSATPTGTVSQPSFSGVAAARSSWFLNANYLPAGTVTGSQGIDHTHNIAHVHQMMHKVATGTVFFMTVQDPGQATFAGPSTPVSVATPISTATNFQTGSTPAYSPNANNIAYYTGGVLSPPAGSSGSGAASGSMSANTSVSGSNFTYNGNQVNIASTFAAAGNYTPSGTVSQPTFSGNSFDVRPKFLDCVYLIRVS